MAPANAEVARYFRETDPYQILVDAFSVTPAGLEAAGSHAELQKHLYLMVLKSALETIGSDKRWERFEVGGQKGILSGDTKSTCVIVDIYCPQTRQFAALALFPHDGATMDDVYECLAQIRIERDPTASRPAAFPFTTNAPGSFRPTSRP
jgi:hypothetical protein